MSRTPIFCLPTMEEFQPSTSRSAAEDEPRPSSSRSTAEDEPQPSTSRSVAEDEPLPSTSRSVAEVEPRPSTSRSAAEDEPPSKRRLLVEEVRAMWNLIKVYQRLGTREQAVAFAEERGLIPREKMCHYHKKIMSIEYSTNKTVGSFVCNRRPCRGKSKVSRGKGTWFENIKITMPRVFYLIYAYANKFSIDRTKKEDFSEGEHCLSSATINNWFNCCREAVVTYQKNREPLAGKIGGPGKVVQIDESKFRKRKYNKVRQVESHWILEMIQDGSEDLNLEVCPDNVRSAEVLVTSLKKEHVAEGTTNTDYWRAYLNDLIYEYLWRRDVDIKKRDPFEELIHVINYTFNK